MIITIKGADFSSANIGTLSTYIISKSIGSGAAFDIPNFVDKNASVNWTITLNEGYTFGTYSVTMGGVEVTPTVVDNVMTISIAEVTGNVRIVVATVNENTGEEDEPTIPDEPVVPPVDPEEPDTPTYYDITEQGTQKGSINDSVITYNTGGYYLTNVPLPENAVSVEYQAFPTGAKFGSAFIGSDGKVVKMLDKKDISVGERVTELVPEGAVGFLHMWDNPNDSTVTGVEPFTYIRVYIDPNIVIDPYIKTRQDLVYNYMLDTSDGHLETVNPTADGGVQCISKYDIPSDAKQVSYLTFKTGASWGSGFFDENDTFISGYAASKNERHTLDIPSNAKKFYFMYPNPIMANSQGLLPFDYVEFIK
jgi:hypothetical protein